MPSPSSSWPSDGRRRVRPGRRARPGRPPRDRQAPRDSRVRRSSQVLSERGRVVALAAAVCLFLATIEYIIPRPLPFLRIGLATLPLLIALDLLPAGSFFLLVALKILGQSLIQGSLFSYLFLFSLSGSLASAGIMWAARKVLGTRMSLVGISILGALASNLSQLALARVLVFGPSAWMIAPPFLLVGLAASAILGVLAELYRRRSTFLRTLASRLGRQDRLPPGAGSRVDQPTDPNADANLDEPLSPGVEAGADDRPRPQDQQGPPE